MIGPDTFEFVGSSGTLASGWNDESRSALWTYNLHYFDDLRRVGAESRKSWHTALIAHWIKENPPLGGAGWAAYPTSLRIVNWIVWDLTVGKLSEEAKRSLADQANWLSRNLETHILGNHLFANLKALVIAGAYFSGTEGERWLATGLGRLASELREQVLADGGNFELSPMYHSIFLTDLLDLIAIDRVFPECIPMGVVHQIARSAARMLGWLTVMTHPDGNPPHFNDCAIGIAPTLSELQSYAARLGIDGTEVGTRLENRSTNATHLEQSGYVRLDADNAVTFCDVGEIGPRYLPGHAHADTLSYELSVGGRRVVVNGGTSCYGTGPARLRERATAAHSTVVASVDSSEVWGGFRAARRAHPFAVALTRVDEGIRLTASHDGFRRLPGKPIHRRDWTMRGTSLEISDHFAPSTPALARNILHPAVAECLPRQLSLKVLRGKVSEEAALHAPQFGTPLETRTIDVGLVDGEANIRWEWA